MAKRSSTFDGGLVHFTGVRLRVIGTGNLELTLYSLDDVNSSSLTNLAMVSTTNKEPLVLSNFIEQMGYLEFRTSAIDETFTISRITMFVKPVATGYPQ